MTKAFKTKVYLDAKATEYCKRAFGVRRCIWNWAVAECIAAQKAGQPTPSSWTLFATYRQNLKSTKDSCFAWLAEQQTSSRLMQEVIKDVSKAFKTARQTKRSQVHFKTRKDRLQTFRVQRGMESDFKVETEHTLSLTGGRFGRITLMTRESLNFLDNPGVVKLCELTISRKAGEYWMCITYEKPNRTMQPAPTGSRVGLDLGVKKSVVAYDGKTFSEASFNTKRSLKFDAMSKAQNAQLSRQIQGSKRYEKNLLLQQKRAAKAARIRKNELEVYTTHLVRTYETIVYDDYSFKGALAVSKRDELYRCMKYEFILRLSQKLDERDSVQGHLIEVPHKKGVKTTRKCSNCDSENVHIRKNRTIQCNNCGYVEDRDYNAARNAYNYC